MTNYEKLISSIMLSAVLSKAYGIGCGCNCDCDEDDDSEFQSEIPIFKPNNIIKKNTHSKYNEDVKVYPYEYDTDTGSKTFYNNYKYMIENVVKNKNKQSLLQLYAIELQSINLNEEEDKKTEEISSLNYNIISQLYEEFKTQYGNTLSKEFAYDFCQKNEDTIKEINFSSQLCVVNVFIDLITLLQEENTTIENFSKACVYHEIKNRQKFFTKECASDFIITKNSPLKPIITELRDQIFLSLFDYIMDYLNLCHLKFGEGFWIKEGKKQSCDLLAYFKEKSDKGKSIKNFFTKQKSIGSYDLYNHICDMPFGKITKIKEKLNVLPNFSDIFEKDKKGYKVKEDKIEEFKQYFNFLEEENQTPLGHEKDINKFFNSLSANYKINETSDEELQGKIFKFNGLQAPEFIIQENIVSKEDNEK